MGFFITLEGIEGCGKTTQLNLLKEFLTGKGYSVVATREPGGTPLGDMIRKLVLTAGTTPIDSKAELMLYQASRAQHMHEVIKPALSRGHIVLCDRFGDATVAYQGYARGLPLDHIEMLNRFTTDNCSPDLTILIDCPVEVGLSRARDRAAGRGQSLSDDRFEKEDLAFHRRVRQGYLEIAGRQKSRFLIVDGTREVAIIQQAIQAAVLGKMTGPRETAG